jgi:hypothetical protein
MHVFLVMVSTRWCDQLSCVWSAVSTGVEGGRVRSSSTYERGLPRQPVRAILRESSPVMYGPQRPAMTYGGSDSVMGDQRILLELQRALGRALDPGRPIAPHSYRAFFS